MLKRLIISILFMFVVAGARQSLSSQTASPTDATKAASSNRPWPQIPLSELQIKSKIPVPGSPDWLGIGYGSVWVANAGRNSISRINPRTSTVLATIPVGKQPAFGVGIGFSLVWITNCGDHTLSQINPKTNKVVHTFSVKTPNTGEGAIAIGFNSLWLMTSEDGTNSGILSRINPFTRSTVAKIKVADKSYVTVIGYGSVWVIGTDSNTVFRINPRTNKVTARIQVGPKPRFSTVGEGGIWTLNQGDGTVSHIDPTTNSVIATVPVGVSGPGGDIAVGDGYVWVSADGFPVSLIDPKTNRVIAQYVGGKGADAIRVGYGSIWVSDHEQGLVWQIDAKQVIANSGLRGRRRRSGRDA